MIRALEIAAEFDLSAYCHFLRSQGIRHRVSEEGLNQVLWVSNEAEVTFVKLTFDKYQAGELPMVAESAPRAHRSSNLLQVIVRSPLTLILIAVNILLFPVGMGSPEGDLFAAMMFVDVAVENGTFYFLTLPETLATGEWWRLFSPMFVHFSWLHIVFNLLWVWEIGRRIELVNGAMVLLGLTLFSSYLANMTQYLMGGPGLFGGMSGVVFGLLGHSLVWSRMVPDRTTGVANGIYIFMLVYLAIGFSGAIDLLGLGRLANGAHLGGLIAGLITGGLAGFLARSKIPVQ